jgi:PhzF family phenazine biosynthesis protein
VQVPIYQVDAFASRVFTGNPAAVCPLQSWLPDAQLQAIAAENNLSETAFFIPDGDAYQLRWFTPAVEVELCGHATLASAHVLFQELGVTSPQICFRTKSGDLTVQRQGDRLAMDFPSRPPDTCSVHPDLARALGRQPEKVLAARDYLAIFSSEDELRALQPNMELLATLDRSAVIATAPGKTYDLVSRFFAPAKGVAEDPVTGTAHCTLIPYWATRLGKRHLHAYQASARGGELWCEDCGPRVRIAGHAVLFLRGVISLD